jgi:hypothetical protein
MYVRRAIFSHTNSMNKQLLFEQKYSVRSLQGVPEGKVNILGGHSNGRSSKKVCT